MTAVQDIELTQHKSAGGNAHLEHGSPPRILVAESQPLYRSLLGKALARGGWNYDIVDTVKAAVAAFEQNNYAMVIVGTDDRRLDGYELARRLRKMENSGSRTAIIALTGDTLQSDRRKRRAAGLDNYIAKPLRQQTLESIIARYLDLDTAVEAESRPLAAVDQRAIFELFKLAGGDGDQLKKLLEECLTDISQMMESMRQAEEDRDVGSLWDWSRGLKGISAQIGAGRIYEISSTIEALTNTGSVAGVDALLQELSLAYERLERDLRTIKPPEQRREIAAPAAPAVPGEVLVAEGDVLTARFLVTALSSNGFKVIQVNDGNSALAQIASRGFQALILNATLSGTDGFGVLAQSRLMPHHENTPVVLLSSRGADQDVVRAFELGADDHISVPFNPMEVIARVRRLVRVR